MVGNSHDIPEGHSLGFQGREDRIIPEIPLLPKMTSGDVSNESVIKRLTMSMALEITQNGNDSFTKPEAFGLEKFKKKLKPWEKKNLNAKSDIRVNLPTIESFEKEVEYVPNATPRVMIRLERVSGNDRVKIKDHKYLKNLERNILEEEERFLSLRHKKRTEFELQRHRNLIIKGIINPKEREVEYFNRHPIYRVNQIMRRLDTMSFTPNDILNPSGKPPKIVPTEPFKDYEKTGYLFGKHKEHYLRVKPLKRYSRRFNQSRMSLIPTREIPSDENFQNQSENNKNETKEWGGEDYPTAPQPSFDELHLVDLRTLLSTNSMTLAQRYLGLNGSDFERDFKPQRSRIIDQFLKHDKGMPMFGYADKISDMSKRGKRNADEFCGKVHRKLFTHL